MATSSFYTMLEQEIFMMQHWPWAISPETPPALCSGEAAQHTQKKEQQFAALDPISALSPQCHERRGSMRWSGFLVGRAAADQPDLCLGLLLLAVWVAGNAHVPGKTAPTNFKRALGSWLICTALLLPVLTIATLARP